MQASALPRCTATKALKGLISYKALKGLSYSKAEPPPPKQLFRRSFWALLLKASIENHGP